METRIANLQQLPTDFLQSRRKNDSHDQADGARARETEAAPSTAKKRPAPQRQVTSELLIESLDYPQRNVDLKTYPLSASAGDVPSVLEEGREAEAARPEPSEALACGAGGSSFSSLVLNLGNGPHHARHVGGGGVAHPYTTSTTRRSNISYITDAGRKGHGQALEAREYADFHLPPTTIPKEEWGGLARHEMLEGGGGEEGSSGVSQWPSRAQGGPRGEACAVIFGGAVRRNGVGKGEAYRKEEAQQEIPTWPYMTHFEPPPSFDENAPEQLPQRHTYTPSSIQKSVKYSSGGAPPSDRLMQWNVDSFPQTRPCTRTDTYQLETWVGRRLTEIENSAQHSAQQKHKEAVKLEWSLKDARSGTNWRLDGFDWQEGLTVVQQYQDVYTQAFRELVRQVSSHCVERGKLMDSLWAGMSHLLEMAINGMLKHASMSDKLQDSVRQHTDDLPRKVAALEKERWVLREQVLQAESLRKRIAEEMESHKKALEYERAKLSGNKPSSENKANIKSKAAGEADDEGEAETGEGGNAVSETIPLSASSHLVTKPPREGANAFGAMEEQDQGVNLLTKLQDENAMLEERYDQLERAFADVQKGEEEAWKENQRQDHAMKSMTPRPAWKELAEEIAGVITHTDPSTKLRTMAMQAEVVRLRQEVERLRLFEIEVKNLDALSSGGMHGRGRGSMISYKFSWTHVFEVVADVDDMPPKSIHGVGDFPQVPKFIRTTAEMEVDAVSKRGIEGMVKEVWREKKKTDMAAKAAGKRVLDMDDFLHDFFRKRSSTMTGAYKTAYNFIRGLKVYDYDADVEMFLKVLTGEVSEEVYHDQMKLCDELLQAFEDEDIRSSSSNEPTGELKLPQITSVLKDFFPHKSPELFTEMMTALKEDQEEKCPSQWEAKIVWYTYLFEEDANFDQGPFAECIRDHHLQARAAFLTNVEKRLRDVCRDGLVRPGTAEPALLSVDPNMDAQQVEEYLARGFKLGQKEYTERISDLDNKPLTIPLRDFMRHLKAGVIKRSKAKVKDKVKGALSKLNKTKGGIAALTKSKTKKTGK
ncbi:hypothetical protein CYMTET_25217 [Cymbomonas tetramitiformis]|uniref:Uncharacterized protein n=1 Tax=Cymbomonas tetramitiformis TaxID=36881 RepID=A0AAE0FU52_9CHLO|nr:hypothetical protein CYMTET_25217 [Cymbomonas tetramitiformis]|eukprot:gene12470-14735_t